MPRVLVVKIKEKGSKEKGCIEYKNEILLGDFRKLALFFSDLELYDANVEKAFQEYLKKKSEGFPW
jgi:hypothetical protein